MRGIAWICCLAGLLPVPQPLTAQEPEVLYERELTPDELDWGTIDYRDVWSWKRSVEEARNRYTDPEQVDDLQYRGICKVELVYPDGADSQFPVVREYAAGSKGYLWARERSERAWGSVAAPVITLGQDKDGFKFRKRELWFVGSRQGYHAIYFEKPGEVGVAHEEFEAPNGERVDASIYKAIERQIPLHEFLGAVVKGEYRVVQTHIGPVLVWDHDPRRMLQFSRVAWTSGDDLAIFVGASTVDPMDLVELYGDKFPSSLPPDLKVDKTAWGREEAQLRIAGLKANLETTGREDRTERHLSRLEQYTYVPILIEARPWLRRPPRPEQKPKLFDMIVKWWEENREKTYWDEELQRLVAKGQTPEEVAEANQKKAEAEQQALRDAFLAIPPQLPTPEHPVLLYERELTEKERTTEAIGQSESPIKQGYLEIVRQYYKDPRTLAEVPEDIFKVELFYRDTEKGIQAFHRLHAVGYWGREWARSEKLQEWRQEATSQIILGEDKDGFKFRGKFLWLRDGDKIYQEQYGEIGYAYEEFEAPNGGRVVAEIYKGIKRPVPLHEFLHGIVRGDYVVRGNYRLVQTDIGPVLVWRYNVRGASQSQLAGAAWTSGDDIAVYVGGENVDPMDLV